ncbi:MAG: restriction endonuclease subunit S [Clostridium sp.]|uniref:restriction endonuclease subunit S n=1 Tax=Clostridium sp. TaxID=1506 RepID=UPI002A7592DF|nr:restriction endonuclease subunit S [Clostridium sp.]MDY2629745.1 restriction endonuclease subunit S [Clostridium sp.]
MNRIQKIKDVCTISGGYAFKSNDFTSEGIPIIRIGDIYDNKVNINSGTAFLKEYNEKLNKFIIERPANNSQVKYKKIILIKNCMTNKPFQNTNDYKIWIF